MWSNDSSRPLTWEADGQRYSATGLAENIVTAVTGRTASGVRGTTWWVLDPDHVPDGVDPGEPADLAGKDLTRLAAQLGGTSTARRDRTDLHTLLAALPAGRWTTYRDVAATIGRHVVPGAPTSRTVPSALPLGAYSPRTGASARASAGPVPNARTARRTCRATKVFPSPATPPTRSSVWPLKHSPDCRANNAGDIGVERRARAGTVPPVPSAARRPAPPTHREPADPPEPGVPPERAGAFCRSRPPAGTPVTAVSVTSRRCRRVRRG